ncbi:G-protein gamma-like domain-containing protein [Polychytrium aggregatum]|uniref:G-protein gamma-like domain-containing protein n=1 Tax=Polychytrium aggregatum TaxID=110093 RepID=UPI0022FDF947|nr:G-protein gamma-like domain-containing protein [Polychytrium aggregatum]KAI9190843.1 G-protein gamma-like domain-containing protein [Polychytrium aggregatum]
MSELKLKKLVEHNQRLKEQLDLPRIPVSEASQQLIKYVKETKDFLLPTIWGPVDKKDDPYSAPNGGCACSVM